VKPSRLFYALIAAIALIHTAAASAGSINMDDPRRVVGREDDVRIDAQLTEDTVSPGSLVGVTYQIRNLGTTPVAVADKIASASYDADTLTITLAVGSEVPQDGKMPHLVTIAAGETKVFRTGATPMLAPAMTRGGMSGPRYVQVKVSILRDLVPFASLIAQQARGSQTLSDELFDQWFESNDTILLNTVPIRFSPRRANSHYVGADRRNAGGSY
jgi:hypothetical protein